MTRSKRRLLMHGRGRIGSIIFLILTTVVIGGMLSTAIFSAWQSHLEEESQIKSELDGHVLDEWKLAENVTTSCEVDELKNEPNQLELLEGRSFEQISEEIFTSTLRQNLESLHRLDPQKVLDSYLVICTRRVPVLLMGMIAFGQRTDFEVWIRYGVKPPFDDVAIKSFWIGSPQQAVVRE